MASLKVRDRKKGSCCMKGFLRLKPWAFPWNVPGRLPMARHIGALHGGHPAPHGKVGVACCRGFHVVPGEVVPRLPGTQPSRSSGGDDELVEGYSCRWVLGGWGPAPLTLITVPSPPCGGSKDGAHLYGREFEMNIESPDTTIYF